MALTEEQIVDMVNDNISYAADADGDVYSRAIDYEQLYMNYIDETTHPYSSNISIPWPYIIVESYLGKTVQMMASTIPYVHVVEEDDDSRQKARMVEKDVNMDLYRQGWPVLCYKIDKQAFKYGTAWVLERPWVNFDGKEMTVFELLPFFHVWKNPHILSLRDPNAWVAYEQFIPKDRFKQFEGNPNYKNLSKIEVWTGDIESEEEMQIRSFKDKQPLRKGDQIMHSDLVKVTFYWSYSDFVMLTNDDNIIRNDKQNFLGKIPIKVITPIPQDNEFWGMSILEEGKGLFAEASENRCQFNDAANLMLSPQYIVDRDRANLKRRTIESRTGNVIWVDDVTAILPQKQDWQLLNMTLKRQQMIYEDIMNYSNAFPQMRGQQQSGTETATEYMGMRSAGELRSDTYNLLLATMSIEDIVRDMVDYKRMFMTSPSNFYYWPEKKTYTASPEDYDGNFSYQAFASFKHQKELERRHYIEAIALVFQNPAFLPFVMPKANEWLERLIDYFDLRSPEQLRLNPEEQDMAQQMAMLNQAMGMIGGGQPAMGEKANRPEATRPTNPMGPMLGNEPGIRT